MFCVENMSLEDAIERLEKHDTSFTDKECEQLASWLHDARFYHEDLDREYELYVNGLME